MSVQGSEDETQLESQDVDHQTVETQPVGEDEEMGEVESDSEPLAAGLVGKTVAKLPKNKQKKEPVEFMREPGKSLFPIARVQKIIKADKEIPIVAKEATFLISLATEEFIRRLCEAGQQVAHREKRSTVQHRDIAAVVRKADEFMFLEEIMPWSIPAEAPAIKRSKPKGTASKASGLTMLDSFVGNKIGADNESDGGDIVMNEDGTMYAAGDGDL
ncbi:hypothetical protein M413DRAFT_444120 [Hebeloma cylindrosporum]|uniref:Transcription factor CBF/NF-Y/archaeal histone domain-containing protein n=1 Tax=Hebeloma cylindrosporum TaxID=76867 RepID=A0A0C3CI66_HEBCY|nr:hypothetical protein M413DRAFT_444120 [Hebeloma cylindrosporum h7]